MKVTIDSDGPWLSIKEMSLFEYSAIVASVEFSYLVQGESMVPDTREGVASMVDFFKGALLDVRIGPEKETQTDDKDALL